MAKKSVVAAVLCLNCGKPLRKWTLDMDVKQGTTPKAYKSNFHHGWAQYDGKPVLEVTRRRTTIYNKGANETATCWLGHYTGYGQITARTEPAFCTMRCGVDFGTKCAEAGYRIPERKTT